MSLAKQVLESLSKILTEDLNLSLPELDSRGLLKIEINGTQYLYKAIDVSPEALLKSVIGLYKYSKGKALAYLKKHAISGRVDESGIFKE